MLALGQRYADQKIILVETYRYDATGARPRKLRQRCFFHGAEGSCHKYIAILIECLYRKNGIDLLAAFELHQVDDRLAAGSAPSLRHGVHLDPVDPPPAGKAKDIVVRIGDKQVIDEIIIFGARS